MKPLLKAALINTLIGAGILLAIPALLFYFYLCIRLLDYLAGSHP